MEHARIDDIATADEETSPAARARRAALFVLARWSAFWPFLLWTGSLVTARALYPWSSALPAGIWGFLILFSFIAWGVALVRTLPGERSYGWGLNGSLGMALTVAVFGVLACLRLVSVTTIVGWTALGPLVACVQRARRGATFRGDFAELWRRICAIPRRPQTHVYLLGLCVIYILAWLDYSTAVMNGFFNRWDDEMAYRGFVRQFLDQGALYESFSFRRAASYGGQSLLQAFVLALADSDRIHIFDNGIALLLLVGLVTGYRTAPQWSARAAVLVAGFMLVTLPYAPHNLGSALSGAAMFVALFRLLDDPGFTDHAPVPNAILVGLLTAALCTLRQNYISAAVGLVAFAHVALFLSPGSTQRREWLRRSILTGACTIAFLLPWMVLAVIAIGTPLYPLIQGNVRPDYGFVGALTFDDKVRWALTNLFVFKPIGTIGMLFAAAVLLPASRRNRVLHAFLFASVIAFCLMIHFFQNFQDTESIARYYLAFVLAFGLTVTLAALSQAARRTAGVLPAAALVLFAVGHQFVATKDHVLASTTSGVTAFNNLLWQRGPSKPHEKANLYRRIQASIPPGERVLVMLDHTHLLDGKRNVLFTFDHPCGAGPKPRPPCFEGPEAMAAYLTQQRIRYLAYQLGPSSPEYSFYQWERKRPAEVQPKRRLTYYERQAIFELDFFGTLLALTASRQSVFHEGEVRVLDLQTANTGERDDTPPPQHEKPGGRQGS